MTKNVARPGHLSFLCSVVAILAQPALAGGPVVITDVPAAAPERGKDSWQGPYLGVGLGMPTGDNVFGRRLLDVYTLPSDWGGHPAYVRAGYDWQRGSIVFGVALEVQSGDISNEPVASEQVICFDSCLMSVTNNQALVGRVGFDLGRTLIYGTVGVARGTAMFTAQSGVVSLGNDTLTGWTGGIGVERRVGQRLSLSAEYRHTDLGTLELDCFEDCESDIAFGMVQLGVNLRW